MAGLGAQIGALNNPQYQTIPDDQTADQGVDQAGPRAATVPRAGAAFGIGSLYDNYKKAQFQQITQATQLSAAARQRITQIYEAGTVNPQLQQDPRTGQQLDQLFKHMGLQGAPRGANGQLDWNALAPVRQLSELPETTLKALRQMQPAQRKAAVKAMHLVGVDDLWLNAPAEASDKEKHDFQAGFNRMLYGGGLHGMTAAGFQGWLDSNRNIMDQTFGEGSTDRFFSDHPEIFSEMQTQATASLTKINKSIAEIQARTDTLRGLTPEAKARIKYDTEHASEAHDMDQLLQVKTKYAGVELRDLPGLDAGKVRQLNASANDLNANARHWNQVVDDLKRNGGPSGQAMKDITKAYAEANSTFKTVSTAYYSALNGLGVSDELQHAFDDARDRLDTVKSAYDALSRPETKAAIAAATAQRATNVTTKPVNTGGGNSNWNPHPPGYAGDVKDSKGNPLGWNGTAWVQKSGAPPQ